MSEYTSGVGTYQAILQISIRSISVTYIGGAVLSITRIELRASVSQTTFPSHSVRSSWLVTTMFAPRLCARVAVQAGRINGIAGLYSIGSRTTSRSIVNLSCGYTFTPQNRLVQQRFYSTPSGHEPNRVSNAPNTTLPKSKSFFTRFIPSSAVGADPNKSASSFRKIVALAKPERKPLGIAIGLLFVSSAVSMSVPFTIGKLIDYFTTTNPVRVQLAFLSAHLFIRIAQQIPFGLSLGQASSILLLMFTAGAVANAGRSMLMRLSGSSMPHRTIVYKPN